MSTHAVRDQSASSADALRGRRVVVCVTGSISAYKAPTIIRQLRAQGAQVRVVATQAAREFIGAAALEAVSGQSVITSLFGDGAGPGHIALASWADLVIIAPASADSLARLAQGRCDDMLGALALATYAPIVAAPAMHTQMWEHPATRSNVEILRQRGVHIIPPAAGALTSGDTGVGRLPSAEVICAHARRVLHSQQWSGAELLAGQRYIVTLGGTREALDPVRYLGNRSSGRQGAALALDAWERGAHVHVIAGATDEGVLSLLRELAATPGEDVSLEQVGSAAQMRDAVRQAAQAGAAVVMAAAVADYRPREASAHKLKKNPAGPDQGRSTAADTHAAAASGQSALPSPTSAKTAARSTVDAAQPAVEQGAVEQGAAERRLDLTTTTDILAELVSDPPAAGLVVVGFAAETGDDQHSAIDYGIAKARRKGAHLLAINAVGESLGFGDVANELMIVNAQGEHIATTQGSKQDVASVLNQHIAGLLHSSDSGRLAQ